MYMYTDIWGNGKGSTNQLFFPKLLKSGALVILRNFSIICIDVYIRSSPRTSIELLKISFP